MSPEDVKGSITVFMLYMMQGTDYFAEFFPMDDQIFQKFLVSIVTKQISY